MTENSSGATRERMRDRMEEIYKRHFDMVYRISFSYLKNPADAEDAVSEVFARLLRKSPVFQSDGHEKAWLIRTTVNVCKDSLRHWWSRRTPLDEGEGPADPAPFAPDETLQAVLELPPRYKDVIYLYYYEGYTTREMAAILQKPHSTVRGRLREARLLLKGVLEDEE